MPTTSPPVIEPRITWVTAAPLWRVAGVQADAGRFSRPALLRFHSDAFMDDLAAVLQSGAPADLANYEATPVSYQARPLGEPLTWKPPAPPVLKLYQPAHGDFTLVAAGLVCREAGLPDRVVDTAQEEQVGFVLRRLASDKTEMAWVTTGPKDTGQKGWQQAPPDALAENEDLLPLFPVFYQDGNRRRRLLVGLAPTSGRETFQASPQLNPPPAPAPPDARYEEVYIRVVAPLISLKAPESAGLTAAERQAASRFILLDLADFLAINAPALWQSIHSGTRPSTTSGGELYDRLVSGTVSGADSNWRAALKRVWDQRAAIMADAASLPALDVSTTSLAPATLEERLRAISLETSANPAALAETPKFDPAPGVRYVVRCVFRRPRCGLAQREVVSHPSEEFVIASFFDFDAPARPIRITMPIDTSPTGLRKFNKNVGFLISNQLRQQMERVTSLKATMDGDLAAEDGLDIGVLCSLSIPIITICALILLILIVNLLNIIFWWLPIFRICLPISLKKS